LAVQKSVARKAIILKDNVHDTGHKAARCRGT